MILSILGGWLKSRSCPVCGTNLSTFEGPADQEAHVRSCLDGGTSSASQAVKYLVYELPAESALVGVECQSLTADDIIGFSLMSSRCHLPGRIYTRLCSCTTELLL